MAAGNEVTLTLAGDESNLTRAFDRVGAASRGMANDVDASSRDVTSGFDRAGESADGAEGKAQGFSDTLTGTNDLMSASGEIASGNYFEGFVMAGQGAADLAGGLASFVIPAMKNMSKEMLTNAATTVKSKAAMVGHKVTSLASAAATKVMTVAQKGLNMAMRMNPIGIIITLIAALVIGIIIAYKRSETFRRIVQTSMKGVRIAFGWVIDKGKDLWNWFKALPGNIGRAFKGLAEIITFPYRTAFSAIKSLWNSTVGGFSISIPDWVPKIGGNSFTIPSMHTGGIVSGPPGSQQLRMLMAGERVSPVGSSGGGAVLEIRSDGSKLADLLIEVLRNAVRVRGGDVQLVLGRA